MALELLKIVGLLMTFGAVSVATFVALRSRTERAGIRSALDDTFSTPLVADSRALAMEAPFSQRVVGPATRRLAGLVYRFGPKGLAEQTKRRLVLAGLADRVDADTFFAISVAAPVVAAALIFGYATVARVPPLAWLFVPASAMFPKMWLTSRVEARQHQIRLALADTLDLLTIAVEAGLGFDAALARVVGAVPGPLSDELYRMLQELRIGVPRGQALKNLADRTDISELDGFITAVNQADVFGISIGKVLRVQAGQLRQKRSQLAEEKAAKTPVKLLFPLILCIFPALFTVLVGPAALNIMTNLFSNL